MPKISFWGKEYECSVVGSEYFIDGKTLDEFVSELSSEDRENLAWLGKEKLREERKWFEIDEAVSSAVNRANPFGKRDYANEIRWIRAVLRIVRPEKMSGDSVRYVVNTIMSWSKEYRERKSFDSDNRSFEAIWDEIWSGIRKFYE